MKMSRYLKKTIITFIICVVTVTVSFYNSIFTSYGGSKTTAESLNILLVTYPRSGSSMLGQLLSTIDSRIYFFEPLFYPCLTLKSCTDYPLFMEQLMTCNGSLLYQIVHNSGLKIVRPEKVSLKKVEKMSAQKLYEACWESRYRISKTIRLRMTDVVEIVARNNIPNLQVVHLLRDPRARYLSLQSGNWNDKMKSANSVCVDTEMDLRAAESLPRHLYTRVRYEDLVRDPVKETTALFKQLYNTELLNKTMDYIGSHMAEGINKSARHDLNNLTHYYNTYRTEGVDVDRWKDELTPTVIQMIQDKCYYVLSELKYEFLRINK